MIRRRKPTKLFESDQKIIEECLVELIINNIMFLLRDHLRRESQDIQNNFTRYKNIPISRNGDETDNWNFVK